MLHLQDILKNVSFRQSLLSMRPFSVTASKTRLYTNNKSYNSKSYIGRFYTQRPVVTNITAADKSSALEADNIPLQQPQQYNAIAPSTLQHTLAYTQLAKAKLSALVVSTTAAGFIAAAGGSLVSATAPVALAGVLTGTALCSASAAAWNQIFEVDRDKLMKRTQTRPLVTGALTMNQATKAAVLWGCTGTALLYATTDPVTTALGVGNIVLYAGVYTKMKQHSIYNTWVGAVVGAIPPVMGWTAATGGSILDIEAFLLGASLYCWQMPHFFALSYMHRVDYQRGGFVMLPVVEDQSASTSTSSGERTANVMVRYAWYLSSIPFIATATQVTSSMFALEGVVLNAYALYVVHKFKHQRTNANARKVFLTSLWYLPSFLMLFLLHSKVWDKDENKDKITIDSNDDYDVENKNALHQYLTFNMQKLKQKGRSLCIHEAAVAKSTDGSKACPVTVAAETSRQGAAVVVQTADVIDSKLSESTATPEVNK